MKKIMMFFCMVFALTAFADSVYLEQNFDSWASTNKKDVPPIGICSNLPQSCTLQKDADGTTFLRFERNAKYNSQNLLLGRRYNIPDNFDFSVTIRLRLGARPGIYFWLSDYKNKPRGGFTFNYSGRKFLAYNAKQQWIETGIPFPKSNEWVTLKVDFIAAEKSYIINMTDANGKTYTSQKFPYLENAGVRNLVIGNIPPTGTSADIDYAKITVADNMNLQNREIGTENATITYNGQELAHEGGVLTAPVKINLPATIEVQFPGKKYLSSVILEMQKHYQLVNYEVIGANAAGSGEAKLVSGRVPNIRNKFQENFVADDFLRAKIKLNGSGAIILTKIIFAGQTAASANEKEAAFRKNIYGEFRSAVYQQQNVANLHLFNARADKKNHTVLITVVNRKDNTPLPINKTVALKPGKNVIPIDITDIPNGDYIVNINDKSGESDSSFRRLLRVYRKFKEAPVPAEIGDISGQKLFFPDEHWLESSSNLSFVGGTSKAVQVLAPTGKGDDFGKMSTEIYLDENGKVNIHYYTLNRNWDADSQKFYRATAEDLENNVWTFTQLPGKPKTTHRSVNIQHFPDGPARADWFGSWSGSHEKFTMYNPEKDGPVKLNQMRVKYSGAIANNTIMWKGTSQDWGVIQAVPRAWYKVWRRGKDDSLLIDTKPMLVDKPATGDFEDPDSTHDNFVGQWLSDDGKTLYFAHARWLLANVPYNSPRYDNMNGLRILYIWKTTDGINFEQTAFTPPDENDSPAYQQYGAKAIRLKNSNGMYLAFVLRYRSDTQQMDTVLAYSWDGGAWHEIKGPVFAENGPAYSWNTGNVIIPNDDHFFMHTVNVGNDALMPIYRVSNYFHHQAAQIVAFIPESTFEKLNVNVLKRSIVDLEKWPLFKEYGGYEGFYKYCQQSGDSIGYIRYRRDGYFYTKAGDETAEMVTKYMTASGKMTANIKIADHGFAKVELIDQAGNTIDGYSLEIPGGTDNVETPLFDTLPAESFKVKITMQNADLYTLNF